VAGGAPVWSNGPVHRWSRWFLAAASSLVATLGHAADLTPAEARWSRASAPVLDYARHRGMPLDVFFDPRAKPGDTPLSVGFEGGRCQLVYAIRGNPDADAALAQAAPDLVEPVIEAMVAHELAHCWRHVGGAWHTAPAGFVPHGRPAPDAALARLRRDMQLTRLEEGFADLVGLAWVAQRHPALYERVHEWFCRVRGHTHVPGAHHDTLAWLDLVKHRASFPGARDPFEQASPLWRAGVRAATPDPAAGMR
jgi:hypothetical protein